MVVAVIDKIVRDGMAVIGVELLEESLGYFSLVFFDLDNEAAGLLGTKRMNVVALEIHVFEVAQFVDLILTNRWLILLPVRYVNRLIHRVGMNPILRGQRYAGMTLGNSCMTAVDMGVGESCSRNTDSRSTPSSPEGVAGSTRANAQGCALFSKVPTNPRKDFDATSESKEAHGLYQV